MFDLVFPACCEKSWDAFKDVTEKSFQGVIIVIILVFKGVH